MKTWVQSRINESPIERHYGRKPRTEIHNYLNTSPKIQKVVSVKPETLQVDTFTNGSGKNDQLVLKAPRKLNEDVSNNFSNQCLEKKRNETNLKV